MPRNLTPLHLRCQWGACPSITQIDSGKYLIVGRSATMAAALERIPVGEGEHAVIVSGELLGNVVPGWKTIDSLNIADKHGEILALCPDYCDGKRPLILRWFKYNGLLAWRDWDNDAHDPTHWLPLPLPPAEKVEA